MRETKQKHFSLPSLNARYFIATVSSAITEIFEINQGVKQGCILSPLLFNIFMSDLQKELEQGHCEPVSIATDTISGCLTWADDLLILSKTEEGLQNMLRI